MSLAVSTAACGIAQHSRGFASLPTRRPGPAPAPAPAAAAPSPLLGARWGARPRLQAAAAAARALGWSAGSALRRRGGRGRACRLAVRASAGEGGQDIQFPGGIGFQKRATADNFTGGRQGIVILSDIFGFRTENIRVVADFLCDKGYDVIVPDMFQMRPWPPGKPVGEGFEDWRERFAGPPERVLDVVANAAGHLRRSGCNAVALVGFCYGGGRAIEALAGDPEGKAYQAAVTFYATRVDPKDVRNVRVPVLMTFAAEDHLVSPAQRGDITEALQKVPAANRVNVFVGRKHGFAHMPRLDDQEEAADADKAMEEMYFWLVKYMK